VESATIVISDCSCKQQIKPHKTLNVTRLQFGSSSHFAIEQHSTWDGLRQWKRCQMRQITPHTSIFQPFGCSGTPHKREGHSRNPMQYIWVNGDR